MLRYEKKVFLTMGYKVGCNKCTSPQEECDNHNNGFDSFTQSKNKIEL